jgi:hypothetical protein
MTILVACLVEFVVYGLLIVFLFGLVKLFVVPSPRYPVLPYGLALALGWFLSYHLSIKVITSTPLEGLPWGHAGENFILPFIPVSLAMFFLVLVRLRERSRPNNAVERDAK